MKTIDVNQPMDGVRYEKANGIATITIDRSARGNSLAPAMQAMFRAIWSDVRDNPAVRVAVITAAGERHFCTGFDVAEADSDAAADDVFVDKPLRERATGNSSDRAAVVDMALGKGAKRRSARGNSSAVHYRALRKRAGAASGNKAVNDTCN